MRASGQGAGSRRRIWIAVLLGGWALSVSAVRAAPDGEGVPELADIVPDEEFAQRVPAIPQADGESPLESLEHFERRVSESLGNAGTPTDAALAAPLEPLDS